MDSRKREICPFKYFVAGDVALSAAKANGDAGSRSGMLLALDTEATCPTMSATPVMRLVQYYKNIDASE